ncbi:hypothetical protein BDY21DRAFT_330136, partial [Lineolata rhizophorae]
MPSIQWPHHPAYLVSTHPTRNHSPRFLVTMLRSPSRTHQPQSNNYSNDTQPTTPIHTRARAQRHHPPNIANFKTKGRKKGKKVKI